MLIKIENVYTAPVNFVIVRIAICSIYVMCMGFVRYTNKQLQSYPWITCKHFNAPKYLLTFQDEMLW